MYTVVKEFRDIYNMKHVYKAGDLFESDEQNRIKNLLDRGLIEGAKAPSFESMTKKELIMRLEEKGIEFNAKQTKTELIELLQGGELNA